MFLQIIREKASNHMVQEQFQHLDKIVTSVFHKIIEVLLILHKETVYQSIKQKLLADQITEDAKYNAYFKDCFGALDGTYLFIYVATINCASF